MRNIIFLAFFLLFIPGMYGRSQPAQIRNTQNLFHLLGYDSIAIQQKIQTAFHQLFFGHPETEAVYFSTGENRYGQLAYIMDVNNSDVRSEGVSYGMMIAVQLDRKDVFDALWNFARCHMYHDDPSHPAYGYFGWSVTTDGMFNDEMPAPDGEAYFATALYFASSRWGDGEDIFDYKTEADRLTADMVCRKAIRGKVGNREITGLCLFDLSHKMIRFTTDSTNAFHTDASYHLPAFYEVWALQGPPAYKIFWTAAAEVSRDYFEKAAHPVTGLTSDYGNFDGTPWSASWRSESSTFSYDAWRTAMNWSVDWHWWRKDGRAVKRSNTILSFFSNQNQGNYVNEYTLSGDKLADNLSIGLIACNAVAALAADNACRLEFVKALWQADLPTGRYRYYDGMLMMMALLYCSGEFKPYL